MTIKQKEYIKVLIEEERDHGFFQIADASIVKLGGDNWEENYESIPNSVVSEVIASLKESIHQNPGAWELGYV